MDQHFVFVGNRPAVYEAAINAGLDIVATFCVEGSYLHSYLLQSGGDHIVLHDKTQFLEALGRLDFDILISNGCPYVLPVSRLGQDKKFINIHPSLLPDLRGKHPVNGAVLFNRDAGATCHLMDDGIDTGLVIAQKCIPLTDDLDLGLLYRLSFMAEKDVFMLALANDFQPLSGQPQSANGKDSIYYSRSENDLMISWQMDTHTVLRQIRAFGIRPLGARFDLNGSCVRVMDAEVICNSYANEVWAGEKPGKVLLAYDDAIIIKHQVSLIKLRLFEDDVHLIVAGDIVFDDQGINR